MSDLGELFILLAILSAFILVAVGIMKAYDKVHDDLKRSNCIKLDDGDGFNTSEWKYQGDGWICPKSTYNDTATVSEHQSSLR